VPLAKKNPATFDAWPGCRWNHDRAQQARKDRLGETDGNATAPVERFQELGGRRL